MEFIIVLVIVAVIGGVLGYIIAKKTNYTPPRNHMELGMVIGTALGLLLSVLFDWSMSICLSAGMVLGEFIGMAIPKKEK